MDKGTEKRRRVRDLGEDGVVAKAGGDDHPLEACMPEGVSVLPDRTLATATSAKCAEVR